MTSNSTIALFPPSSLIHFSLFLPFISLFFLIFLLSFLIFILPLTFSLKIFENRSKFICI